MANRISIAHAIMNRISIAHAIMNRISIAHAIMNRISIGHAIMNRISIAHAIMNRISIVYYSFLYVMLCSTNRLYSLGEKLMQYIYILYMYSVDVCYRWKKVWRIFWMW